MPTRRETVRRIASALSGLYEEREALSIARLATAELGGLRMEELLTDPEAPLHIEGLNALTERLSAGCPVQYLLGQADFCGMKFKVREGVLIPRPETEELVAWIAAENPGVRTLLDVGTGSGCIAIALKRLLPDADISAADISADALAVAAENCKQLRAEVTLRQADALRNLAEVFPGPFEIIVSNPPYVPQHDLETMHPNVRDFEPHTALFVPEEDPLIFYRAIARAARRLLMPGGKLYFEIYERFGDTMHRLLQQEGYTDIHLREDLYGKPRMLCCRLN